MLANIAGRYGANWVKSVTLFGSHARRHRAPDGTEIAVLGLEDIRAEHVDGAIVIHLAYLTKEKVDILGERAFTDGNLAIDDFLLNALAEGRPKSLFIASSGAAALAESGRGREAYGVCKLRQEDRFLAWSAKTGVPTLVGRIFNIAGPYINKTDSYAVGSFATQARRLGKIKVEARIPVFRSFLHVKDLCDLILGAAFNEIGRSKAIDLCGAEVLEMGDIARAVSEEVGENIPVFRDSVDGFRCSAYLGNFVETKILAMDVNVGLTPFSQQVRDTLAWIAPGK